MKELQLAALKADLPEHGLVKGDIGTVVLVHGDGEGYEVEFATLTGKTVAVITLSASRVRPVNPREIAHARKVAV